MAEELDVSSHTVFHGLKRIGKVKKLEKWVPHDLNDRQKLSRFEVCVSFFYATKTILFCIGSSCVMKSRSSTTTGDVQDSGWTSMSHPGTSQRRKPTKKTVVTVWWSATGVIHYNFLQPGQTITAESYCEEIDEMYRKLRRQQPPLVNRRCPILLHDNVRPHVSQITVRK